MAIVFAGALVLAIGMRLPGFVHHDTTEVVMWAHSGWVAGFWKHPPLLPWIVRAWSQAVPLSPLGLAVLTALNMTVAAWAVVGIALMADERQRTGIAVVTVLLLAAVPYASGMAVKLNHNSILISLWPLTILSFLRALDRPTVLRGALFGLACAAAMLAKYYSALLLLACVAASFASPVRARRFYGEPAPYVAVAAFILAMLPHALWMLDHKASALAYAFHEPEAGAQASKRGGTMAAIFALQAPAILTPMALAAALLWRHARADRPDAPHTPHRFEREILILTVLPFLLTIAMTAAFNLRGATAWAMPLFLALPALAAARIGPLAPRATMRAAIVAAIVVAVMVTGTQIAVRQGLKRGADGLSEPRQAIAEAATAAWRAATGRPLALVAGDQRLVSAAVIFSPDHPQAWPSFNPVHAPWVTPKAALDAGFVALCRQTDPACAGFPAAELAARAITCPIRRKVRVMAAEGPIFEAKLIIVMPTGATVPAPAIVCPAADEAIPSR